MACSSTESNFVVCLRTTFCTYRFMHEHIYSSFLIQTICYVVSDWYIWLLSLASVTIWTHTKMNHFSVEFIIQFRLMALWHPGSCINACLLLFTDYSECGCLLIFFNSIMQSIKQGKEWCIWLKVTSKFRNGNILCLPFRFTVHFIHMNAQDLSVVVEHYWSLFLITCFIGLSQIIYVCNYVGAHLFDHYFEYKILHTI
jgi:hypothetical protein